jgi:hypothetical protein
MKRLLTIALIAGCGSNAEQPTVDAGVNADAAVPADAYVDQSGPVFEPTHIVDVSITMAPQDWDAMRVQTRTFNSVIEGNCLAQPIPSPFTTFTGSITIDGTTFAQVGIKKKGFFGSLDPNKPSIKVSLDQYFPNQEYLGLQKITLNNSHQDPSFVRQCITYQAFAAAGIVVPRCNFAHVHVNGKDMGVYVNVETIDHRLMKKRYADGTGNLYEGTLSDFRTNWVHTFNGKGSADGSDLVPISNVLETSSDATLEADLAQYIDLDKFYTYWAMEVITNHWDGYANDKNNYFVYHNPTTDKLELIPWGVDATYQQGTTFGNLGSTTGPVAVAAAGILAFRLFAIPASKQKFLDRQRSLLTSIWNESAALAEVTRIETLITPIADPADGTSWHAAVTGVRQFINGRRAALTAAINANPTWPDPLAGYPCLAVQAHVTGTFSTTWGTLAATNPFTTGSGTFSITINGVTTTLTPVGAKAGYDPNPPAGTTANAVVQAFGVRASDNHIIAVSIAIPPGIFFPRAGNLGFVDGLGAVFDFDPATNTATNVGFMLGTFTLTKASTTNGAQIVGSFDANADVQGTPP